MSQPNTIEPVAGAEAVQLLGRGAESAAIGELLAGAMAGSGGALVLHGPAGIGKSALLEAGQLRAMEYGMQVLRARGVPAEASMPFSGLQQLLMPLRNGVQELPRHQRDALTAAVGGNGGKSADLFGVGLAALELLADAGTAAPLLLLVEDAHWLDRATLAVLGFVARRVAMEPIAVLFAVREGVTDAFAESALPELPLGPLDEESARTLLTRGAPQASRELQERVLLEAAGNPLALLELPAAASTVPHLAWAGVSRLPVGSRLERAFAARLGELPERTRSVLLVASAGEGCSLTEVLAAAGSLYGSGVGLDALEPAAAAGLIEPDAAGVRFRHPLVASAVYHGVSAAKRVTAHAALAEVLKHDADRSLWHQASAAIGKDASVSAQLEEFATRAYDRGAVIEAVTGLERAAALDPDPHRGSLLLLHAARLNCELGRFDDARAVLARTDRTRLQPADQARLTLLEETSGRDTTAPAGRIALLVQAADTARKTGEQAVAAELLWAAASRCWWNCPMASERELVAQAAERADPEGEDLLMLAVRAYATPTERGAFVLERLDSIRLQPDDLAGMGFLASATMVLGEHPTAARAFAAAQQLAREQGRLGLLTRLLSVGAWPQLWTVRWDEVLTAAAEVDQLAVLTGEVVWQIVARIDRALVIALRGSPAAAEAELIACQAHPALRTAHFARVVAQMGRGLAALADGRYSHAFDLFARLLDPADPLFHFGEECWGVVGYLAEAALGSDRIPEAREHLRRLEPLALQTPSSVIHIGMRYARAVLAPDSQALPAFEEALSADLADWPFDHARLLLAHGMWQRRTRHPAESRASLRLARDIFDSLGARPWGERTRRELRAAGEGSAERTAWAREDLTAQELQIALKAAQGLTNREIGQDLFLSHRTVSSHLYRVFPKLGITRRSQLAEALAQGKQAGPATG